MSRRAAGVCRALKTCTFVQVDPSAFGCILAVRSVECRPIVKGVCNVEPFRETNRGAGWGDVERYLRELKLQWGGYWDIRLFSPGGVKEGAGLYVVCSRRELSVPDRYERWIGAGEFIRLGSGARLPDIVRGLLARSENSCRLRAEVAERQAFF